MGRGARAGLPRERQVHGVDSDALGAALDWHWEGEAGRTGRFSIEPGRGGAFPLVFHPEDPQKGLSSKRVMTFAIRKCPREATMPLRGEEPERGGQADRGAGRAPWDGAARDLRRRVAGQPG